MGVIVIIVFTCIHRKNVIDVYTAEDDDGKNIGYIAVFIFGTIIWPVLVFIEVLHIISLLVPWYIKLLKDLPDISIKINKSDE